MSKHFALASREPEFDHVNDKLSWWKQWLQQPQRDRGCASACFKLHYWIGAVAGAYLTLMSVTGSILVFRDQLSWLEICRVACEASQ